MPNNYVLRDLPADLWTRFTTRANQEKWPLRALIVQLLDDFGSGRIVPSTPAPSDVAEYAWLRPHFRPLAKEWFFQNADPSEKWRLLYLAVANADPLRLTALAGIFAGDQAKILNWLQETTKKDSPEPNRLTMRPIAHIGKGADLSVDRRVYQYEVKGLPPGQQAWIADFGKAEGWRILRAIDGEQGHWEQRHLTAEEALRALEYLIDTQQTS